MAYRDENQHLRARVDELEDELDAAQRRIRELEGAPTSRERTLGARLAGGPLRIVHEMVLDGELPVEAHEEIVEILRRRYNVLGQASSVGKGLAWANVVPQSTRAVEVSVSCKNGKTTVRGVERLGNLAGGLFGGIVGGAGGGGTGLLVPLLMATKSAEYLPFVMLAWITTIYAAVRLSFSRVAAGRERELRAAIDEVASAARESIAQDQQKKVRVDADEPEEAPLAEEGAEMPEPRRARRD